MKISKWMYEKIIAHAQKDLPNEACGYLAGIDDRIKKCYPMTNTDNSPVHFSFDPNEQLEVYKRTKKLGLDLIACYHSHPTSHAFPSNEDIRLAYDEKMVYIIISLYLDDPIANAFKIKNKEVFSEPLLIV